MRKTTRTSARRTISQITAVRLYGYAARVATVAGLFVSPGRGTGRSDPRDRVRAIESQGLEGCAHANPPRREVLLASQEHLDALGVEPGAVRGDRTVTGADV